MGNGTVSKNSYLLRLWSSCFSVAMLISLCAASCQKPAQSVSNEPRLAVLPKEITNLSAILDSIPCQFDDRAVVTTIPDTEGVVAMSVGVFILKGDGFRYLPCNLPEALQKEGVKVKFSGNTRAIKPNERWAAQPFKLTHIEQLK